jgi:sensor histidine kinase YesM
MKLSKLMRYLLYENQNEKILLSKEFDFVKNYFALMKLRLVEDVEIYLKVPDSYADIEIPVMLFFPYLENAFKYGTSYQNKSRIEAIFEVGKDNIVFQCRNSKNVFSEKDNNGGTGFRNSRQRLDLLYADRYSLLVNETDDTFSVTLRIPVI